jgi:ABC-type uncharacterized transport system permease subunit
MPSAEAKLLTFLALAAYATAAAVAWAARGRQREAVGRLASVVLAAGISLSLAGLVLRAARGHLPAASGFDTFTLLALLTGAASAYLKVVDALPRMEIVLPIVSGAWSALAVALGGAAYRDFARDVWAVAHVTFAAAATVGFAAAAIGGWLYLRKYRQLRRKDPEVFHRPLPSLERLDRFLRHALPVAFVLVTATIVTGVVGALQPQHEGFFRNWATHPKMLTAGITWLLYTLALHAAYARRFRARAAAVLSAVGFFLLIAVLVASMLLPKA